VTRGGRGEPQEGTSAATRLAAAASLLAVAVVPLFANPLSARVFEAERAIVLRLLGVVALAAALFARSRLLAPATGRAIGIGAMLYVAGTIVSCFAASVPSAALAGEYGRQAGLLTDLALLGVFGGGAALASRGGTGTLLRAVLAGGAILAAAAIVDVAFHGASRAAALAGGATLLATPIAAAIPLALAATQGRTRVALLVVLVAGLIATGSRGAVFAALLGAGAAAILRDPRLARRTAAIAGLLVLLLAVFALPPLRRHLPESSLPSRFAALLDDDGSADAPSTRGLMIRDGLAALGVEPLRIAIGHGPDATGVAFTPHVSPGLQRRLGGAARLDRFHCDPLDLLYTRGAAALLGFALMLGAALVAARRLARDAARNPAAAALGGALVVLVLDSLIGVPGAASRVLTFACCGALAALGRAEVAPSPAGLRDFGARAAPRLLGAILVTLLFATDGSALAGVAIVAVPLLVTRAGFRAPLAPAVITIAYVALSALTRVLLLGRTEYGAASTPGQESLAHGIEIALFDLAILALVIDLARVAAPRSRLRMALGAALALVALHALHADFARQRADAKAALASRALAAGMSQPAIGLLEDAASLAPEVTRYRLRLALAHLDAATRGAPPEAAWQAAGTAIALALEAAPNDAFARVTASQCLMRFRELLPQRRALILAQAARILRPALALAPTATPVLLALAEVELEDQEPEIARERITAALAIDGAPGYAHLLLGRVHAGSGELAGAASAYALALRGGAGRAEALAAIALTAAASGDPEAAADVLARILDLRIDDGGASLTAQVSGARPLLAHVPYPDWRATFDRLRERRPDAASAVAALERALDY
jgi:hypothetical protein